MANPNNYDLTQDGLFFLASSICSTCVCAPEGWTAEQVEAEVNLRAPTGISSRWQMPAPETITAGAFVAGNPQKCSDAPGRRHWLLEC